VYGVEPLRVFAVSTTNWPLSIAGDGGVTVAVSKALTGRATTVVDTTTPVASDTAAQ
jgi:hypothetical protein